MWSHLCSESAHFIFVSFLDFFCKSDIKPLGSNGVFLAKVSYGGAVYTTAPSFAGHMLFSSEDVSHAWPQADSLVEGSRLPCMSSRRSGVQFSFLWASQFQLPLGTQTALKKVVTMVNFL